MTADETARQAARDGDVAGLRQLHASGLRILGDESPTTLTSLHLAAATGNVEMVAFLLEAGANPKDLRINSFSPMHSAATNGRTSIISVLLDAGADPNVQTTPQGYTPLHSAAWAEAVAEYNRRVEREKVVALIHSTC